MITTLDEVVKPVLISDLYAAIAAIDSILEEVEEWADLTDTDWVSAYGHWVRTGNSYLAGARTSYRLVLKGLGEDVFDKEKHNAS